MVKIAIIAVGLVAIGLLVFFSLSRSSVNVNNFNDCKAAGNPIMESYPERCSAGGKTFTNPDQKVINP